MTKPPIDLEQMRRSPVAFAQVAFGPDIPAWQLEALKRLTGAARRREYLKLYMREYRKTHPRKK